ncbi:hypothetical protein U3A55_01220 [Salarchaeum sp. III]|uniref:hypothetical protein n=1 Tax=Salarchaeum sp. III TaxID=3107927 RepID=UPI002ED82707
MADIRRVAVVLLVVLAAGSLVAVSTTGESGVAFAEQADDPPADRTTNVSSLPADARDSVHTVIDHGPVDVREWTISVAGVERVSVVRIDGEYHFGSLDTHLGKTMFVRTENGTTYQIFRQFEGRSTAGGGFLLATVFLAAAGLVWYTGRDATD